MLGLPMTIDIHTPTGDVVRDQPMWTYWNLQEGEITVDPLMFDTADGGAPPVIHLDTDAPLYTDDGELITDELWGIYYKRDRHGVQGGASPLTVDGDVDLDPYPSTTNVDDELPRHVVRGALARDEPLRGLPARSTSRPAPGGVGSFTADNFPVFDYLKPNVYGILDSNHGYKMIGVGREVARVLLGDSAPLLTPFRFERFATGRPPPRLELAVPLELTPRPELGHPVHRFRRLSRGSSWSTQKASASRSLRLRQPADAAAVGDRAPRPGAAPARRRRAAPARARSRPLTTSTPLCANSGAARAARREPDEVRPQAGPRIVEQRHRPVGLGVARIVTAREPVAARQTSPRRSSSSADVELRRPGRAASRARGRACPARPVRWRSPRRPRGGRGPTWLRWRAMRRLAERGAEPCRRRRRASSTGRPSVERRSGRRCPSTPAGRPSALAIRSRPSPIVEHALRDALDLAAGASASARAAGSDQ